MGYGWGSDPGVGSVTGIGSTTNRQKNLAARATDVLNVTQKVEGSLIELFTASSTKAKGQLAVAKSLTCRNVGEASLAVCVKVSNWTAETTKATGDAGAANPASIFLNFIVPRGQSLVFPSARVVSTTATSSGGTAITRIFLDGDVATLANTAPDANMYSDSTANVDSATADGVVGSSSSTTLYLEPYTSAANCTANLFRVGDLIRLSSEIMEVTAIGDKSDLANNYLTVKRGLFGSGASTFHADGHEVRFAFFNSYHDFEGLASCRTNKDGRFKANNFFGKGRATTNAATGIVPGSVSIKCYERGYQELGFSGVTTSTNSGLAAGTEYKFNIAVDGGTAFSNLTFTTDASNLNFGGRNGILIKIQNALNTQYYTAGNLFERRVYVSLVDGDIRFTSGSYLSSSAILLAAPDSGTTPFGVGRIPAIGDIQSAVAAKLPSDTITDDITGESVSNTSVFMYDDGNGNLIGKGLGTINYDSGAIDFLSYRDSEFVISAAIGGALAGSLNADYENVIEEVSVQSMNSKLTGRINLVIGG